MEFHTDVRVHLSTYGMVEELLQFFVGVIDAELLEAVEVEDLEARYI